MKFFAKLGLNSKVVGSAHLNDSDAPTEEAGIAYLNKHRNYPFWKEYKMDGSMRKNCADIGSTYDEARDAFIPPKYYASWVLNETTCQWEAPVAAPDTNERHDWNEATKSWDQ